MTKVLESIPFLTPGIWPYSQPSGVTAIVLEVGYVFPFLSTRYKGMTWFKQSVAMQIEDYWWWWSELMVLTVNIPS